MDGFEVDDPLAMIRGDRAPAEVAAEALYDQVRDVAYRLNCDRAWWDWWQASGVEGLWLQTSLLGPGPRVAGKSDHRVANRGRRQHKVRLCLDLPADLGAEDYVRQRGFAVAYLTESLTFAAESFKLGPLPDLPALPPPTRSDRNPYAGGPPAFAKTSAVPELSEPQGRPSLLAIVPDDYKAEHVGRTSDGRQFFLTTPFAPGGDDFVALYVFDSDGLLLDALIDSFGPRATCDDEAFWRHHGDRLAGLGDVEITRIDVAPFEIERFGMKFGLIPRAPEDDGEDWNVEVQPGNYMAFYPPWDGEYDT
jgi:hypothetical protein